jgi:hypothetical protein
MTVRGDAENAIFGERGVPARMAGTGGSVARKIILVMTGLGVLCLSFWITLTIIDTGANFRPGDVRLTEVPLTNEDGSPRSTRASKVSDLLHTPVVPPFATGWDGLERLNALVMGPGPTGGGNLALSLVATRDTGYHRIGLAFARIPAQRPIHAIAWIKAPQGTRIRIDARDGQESGHPAPHNGSAVIELSPPKVLSSSGDVRALIGSGPSNWVKIPVEMPSTNGVLVIYFSLLGPGNAAQFGGSGEQMVFGGIELTAG